MQLNWTCWTVTVYVSHTIWTASGWWSACWCSYTNSTACTVKTELSLTWIIDCNSNCLYCTFHSASHSHCTATDSQSHCPSHTHQSWLMPVAVAVLTLLHCHTHNLRHKSQVVNHTHSDTQRLARSFTALTVDLCLEKLSLWLCLNFIFTLVLVSLTLGLHMIHLLSLSLIMKLPD